MCVNISGSPVEVNAEKFRRPRKHRSRTTSFVERL